jgi:hypothetical protein
MYHFTALMPTPMVAPRHAFPGTVSFGLRQNGRTHTAI